MCVSFRGASTDMVAGVNFFRILLVKAWSSICMYCALPLQRYNMRDICPHCLRGRVSGQGWKVYTTCGSRHELTAIQLLACTVVVRRVVCMCRRAPGANKVARRLEVVLGGERTIIDILTPFSA